MSAETFRRSNSVEEIEVMKKWLKKLVIPVIIVSLRLLICPGDDIFLAAGGVAVGLQDSSHAAVLPEPINPTLPKIKATRFTNKA